MRLHTALVVTILVIALALIPSVEAPAAYTLTVNPSYPVLRGTTMTLTLNLGGGSKNSAYGVVIGVTKPNGSGQASTPRTILTDSRGIGGTTLAYPDPSFTSINGTVATDVAGIYAVQVNQTGPFFQANVANAQFTVISQLTVLLSQPTTGSFVQRGAKLTITASVSSPGGPVTTATVSTNAPSGGKIYLQQISNGFYSTDYTLLMYDPLGTWSITASASDLSGNSGVSGTNSITIIRSNIVVDRLTAYNSKGAPASDFSPGDAIYPFFRLSYSTGNPLTSGQYRVAVKNPSGQEIANLTAVYDTTRLGFYTTTGYLVSQYDPAGSWTIAVDAGSVNDGFGNVGPSYATSINISIVTVTSPWGFLPFLIGGMVALGSGALLFKKYDKSTRGFEYLEQLMGGPMPRDSSILILGDAGSGKTILSYEILYDELENGRHCAVLSYDAFPEDVQARMTEFGWDITSHLRKGRLKIVDCYSGLAGEGEGAIKDPSDLTELNIRVTSIIGHARGKPVTLVLDSLTPIFNGAESKQAITFLQTVGAKVKKTGGVFLLTGSTGAVAEEALAKIKSFSDGVIELTLVRTHRKIARFLSVLKMERRKISTETVPFEIDRKQGFVFHVSRVKGAFLRTHLAEPSTAPKPVQKSDGQQKQPSVDTAQKPEPVLRLQNSSPNLEALPKWGRREAPAGLTESRPEDGGPNPPGLFGRLRAATDRLWGVPPSAERVQVSEPPKPARVEQIARQEKPSIPRLQGHEPSTTPALPSTGPSTGGKTSPQPELQANQPSKGLGKAAIDKRRTRNRPKTKTKDSREPEKRESKEPEPQSSGSIPSPDDPSTKTPTASGT